MIAMNDEILARTPADAGASRRDRWNRGVFRLAHVRFRDRRDHLR